ELKRSLIPYANRAVMLGTRLPRALQRGDVVFARDLTPPDDGQKWDVIGPFELISVGEQFTESSGRGDSSLRSTRGNTITIAVGADFDARTTRLLNVISADVGGKGKAAAVKIVAVQVLPAEGQARPASSTVPPAARADTAAGPLVYQTVSLEGIPNVPGVLLAGDFIRFVVPQEPRY
ncbi:MAG: hypothetical protein KDA60_22100, partial [Planctomycetales bacterium]|nr:hypothetical protein [Planctomycetales bacterium]